MLPVIKFDPTRGFVAQLIRLTDEEAPHHRYFQAFDVGGQIVSIQASRSHYCEPQANVEAHLYTHFEVMWWAGSGEVSGYVPEFVIQEFLLAKASGSEMTHPEGWTPH